MADPDEGVFPRFIYVPWVDDEPHTERAERTVTGRPARDYIPVLVERAVKVELRGRSLAMAS